MGSNNSNYKKSLWINLLVMALWGSLYPVVKLGYQGFGIRSIGGILLFAGLRFAICGGAILLFCLIKEKRIAIPPKSIFIQILWSGFFAIVLHYSLTYIGLSMTDSSKTAILKQVGTLFYICFSFLFFKADKPTMQKILGALLGFGGIIAINASFSGFDFHIGDLFILLSSFCIMFSNVLSKKVFDSIEPIISTGISQFFGGVVLLVAGKSLGGTMTPHTPLALVTLLYICIASIIGYCLWFWAVKRNDLSELFIIKFAEPVFACIFSALILKESIFKLQYLASFILVVSGIYITRMKTKK